MAPFEWGNELPTLPARRLDLRWITHDDGPAILSIFGDPRVMQYWSSPRLQDLASARELIDQIHGYYESRTLFQWGICLRDGKELIGTTTLCDVDLDHRRGTLGFALRRSAWGQGYATEAVEAIIAFAFEVLGLQRLEADVDPENERSLTLLERQGFRKEGYLRERWHHLGELRDTVFLGLLRREWTPRIK